MWLRMRLDIGWRDLLAGYLFAMLPARYSASLSTAVRQWNAGHDALLTLSVRSAFDLALRALELPKGSEVLLSAWTVPDMERIVRLHGLVPVPVDLDDHGVICQAALQKVLSPRAKVLVVAHLFGGKSDLFEVCQIARQNSVLVIEDCAQRWSELRGQEHEHSDLAMFSFGPIKSATALGGAVVEVRSPELRAKMGDILARDPIQSRWSFLTRLVRFGLLFVLSGRVMAFVLKWLLTTVGLDFDSLVNSSARGFRGTELLPQIRKRPSTPQLRLMTRRWKNYRASRIRRRVELGRRMDQRLGMQRPVTYNYWIYPVFVQEPSKLVDQLSTAGFDATTQSRMAIVATVDLPHLAPVANHLARHVVFLPWYPELSLTAIETMAAIIRQQKAWCSDRYSNQLIGN
jgi:perosamine synthetase